MAEKKIRFQKCYYMAGKKIEFQKHYYIAEKKIEIKISLECMGILPMADNSDTL